MGRVRALLLDAEWRAHPLLLETLRESLLPRPKMPSRTVLKVDVLVKRAAAQSARKDPDVFFDQKKSRMAFLNLFRRLQGAGRGRLIVGRRGHPTRFQLRDTQVRLEIETLLREIGITVFSQGQMVKTPGFDERDQPLLPARLTREQVVEQLKEHHAAIRRFGVSSLALFGSLARDEGKPESDVDLLVAFKEPITSDGFFGVKFFLEDLLGRRIDLVTEASLRAPIRAAIQSELISVA